MTDSSERPIPRYCRFEDPPALCTRGCGMGTCTRSTRAADDRTCSRCGHPARRAPTPPEQKIMVKLDDETRPIFESAERAAAEVASWPDWKANECRCPTED